MRRIFLYKWAVRWLAAVVFSGLMFHIAPLPKALKEADYASLLLAADGQLLSAKIAADHQWRFPPVDELPHKYKVALTHFEDRYFYVHFGVNPFAIARAMVGNLKAGRVTRGGSTITMQLARMLRGDPPRTYVNKAIEVLLALKLEWHFNKEQIVLLYANRAPFGGNTVGIAAAKWRYFGGVTQVGSVSWAEAALLAVLPNSPALIHPGRGRDRLLRKRNHLLTQLWQAGHLNDHQYHLSRLEALPGKPARLPQLASHLLHTALKTNDHKTIHTTLDATTQQRLENLARFYGKRLTRDGVYNLSALVIDNRSLELVAYLGNMTSSSHPEQHGFAVDIARRPRSSGSILKPLLYGLMLEDGLLLPDTLVPDVPTNFKGFTPENYDHQYRGAVPARQALAQSLNIPAVKMLQEYGYSRFYDELKSMGVSTLLRPPDHYGLSLILGGGEVSLWEVTGLYAKLKHIAEQGNQGQFSQPIRWQRTPQSVGTAQSRSSLQQGGAWLTLDALLDVARPLQEQGWQDFYGKQKIAWKTGTSYGLRDAWSIGSNGKYTVGIWAGNAGGEGVAGLSGLTTSAPLMFQVFNFLGPAQWPVRPDGALKEVSICADDGFLMTADCPSATAWAPAGSHFQSVSPHFQRVQLDHEGRFRVHGGCEKVSSMQSHTYMLLPPLQEHYWRGYHADYAQPPPWREDCLSSLAQYTKDVPLEIVYPTAGATIYLPKDLQGQRQKVVFEASHRHRQAQLFWHIDNQFVERTELFHQLAVDVKAGWHKLTLVDQVGYRVERWFKVLN